MLMIFYSKLKIVFSMIYCFLNFQKEIYNVQDENTLGGINCRSDIVEGKVSETEDIEAVENEAQRKNR